MAYASMPTIVHPLVPADAITTLELLVLTQMYDWKRDGDGIAFFSEGETPHEIRLIVDEAQELLEAMSGQSSILADLLRPLLDQVSDGVEDFYLKVGDLTDARIFQDILHRCPKLEQFTIVSDWNGSKVGSDGVGGKINIVTRDQIQSYSSRNYEASARCASQRLMPDPNGG